MASRARGSALADSSRMSLDKPDTPSSPEEVLTQEARERPRGGSAALAGALLTFVSPLYTQVGVLGDFPRVGVFQAVEPALNGRPEALVDPRSGGLIYLDDRALQLILASAASALGALLIGYALYVLLRSTQVRRPETPVLARYLIIVGPVLFGVATFGAQVARSIAASDFASGTDRTPGTYDDAFSGGLTLILSTVALLGQLILAFALVITSLNAMRAGLLTRFMGVLGCIVGALLILPALFGPPAIVQSFWLVALGLLVLGRGRALPPAWATGRAEPWPTQQELRERKERKLSDASPGDDGASSDAPAGSGGATGSDATTGSVALGEDKGPAAVPRRKRKRR